MRSYVAHLAPREPALVSSELRAHKRHPDWFMVLEDNTPPPLPDAEGSGPTLEEIRSITAEHYEEEDQTPVLPQSSEVSVAHCSDV